MRTFCSRTLAIAAAVLLAACGGGGDGAPPPPPSQVRITMANQDAVTLTSLVAVSAFDGLPGIHIATAPAPVRPAQAGAATSAHRAGLTHTLIQALGTQLRATAPVDLVRPLDAGANVPCGVSGSVDMTLADRDNSGTMSPGDVLSMAFNQCVYVPGSSYNGLMALTFATVTAGTSGFDVTGTMIFQQLAMIDGSLSLTMTGVTNAHLAEVHVVNGANELGNYTATADGLALVVNAPGYADRIAYSPGFNYVETGFVAAAGSGLVDQGTLRAGGEFRSDALGGTLMLATVSDFRFDSTVDYPLEGQMTATGLDNTMLGLAATGGPQARIDVCDDGDGVWEATRIVDWDSL
jgi:hypothetical protein